jgi:hypothetical protein
MALEFQDFKTCSYIVAVRMPRDAVDVTEMAREDPKGVDVVRGPDPSGAVVAGRGEVDT